MRKQFKFSYDAYVCTHNNERFNNSYKKINKQLSETINSPNGMPDFTRT